MNGVPKMEVVNLRRMDNGKVKAFADVLFDESYVVKGFRVVEGSEGMFVGFPQTSGKNGKWYDVFQAVNNEVKDIISEAVMASYQE